MGSATRKLWVAIANLMKIFLTHPLWNKNSEFTPKTQWLEKRRHSSWGRPTFRPEVLVSGRVNFNSWSHGWCWFRIKHRVNQNQPIQFHGLIDFFVNDRSILEFFWRVQFSMFPGISKNVNGRNRWKVPCWRTRFSFSLFLWHVALPFWSLRLHLGFFFQTRMKKHPNPGNFMAFFWGSKIETATKNGDGKKFLQATCWESEWRRVSTSCSSSPEGIATKSWDSGGTSQAHDFQEGFAKKNLCQKHI